MVFCYPYCQTVVHLCPENAKRMRNQNILVFDRIKFIGSKSLLKSGHPKIKLVLTLNMLNLNIFGQCSKTNKIEESFWPIFNYNFLKLPGLILETCN